MVCFRRAVRERIVARKLGAIAMTLDDLKRLRAHVETQRTRDLTDAEIVDLEELLDQLDDETDDNVTCVPDPDEE
jgi:hypothetical protein